MSEPDLASLRAAIGTEGSVVLEDRGALGHGDPGDEVKRIGGGRLPCGEVAVESRYLEAGSHHQHARLLVDGAAAITLDGLPGQPKGWMEDGMDGPVLDVAGTPGAITWRSLGSRLRPMGRQRTLQVAIGDERWQLWGNSSHFQLGRGTKVGRRTDKLLLLGEGGLRPGESEAEHHNIDSSLYVEWTPQTTHLETLLGVLLMQVMAHDVLMSLPEKVISAAFFLTDDESTQGIRTRVDRNAKPDTRA